MSDQTHDPTTGHRAAPQVGQPATLGRRFVARLIDFILLGAFNGLVISALFLGSVSASGGVTTWPAGGSSGAEAIVTVLSTAVTLGYFTIMEATRGQTVGKMLLSLRTTGPQGGNPTMEQALKRNAWTAIGILGIVPFLEFLAGLLSLAAVVMIAVTINRDTATRHGWHDDFAGGTTVVRTG